MNSLLNLISIFFIGFLMTLSGYMVALFSDWMRRIIVLPIIIMLLFDTAIVLMYYFIGTTKIQLTTGIMLGVILKIIVFILYNKYLTRDDE
tara:strand:+ start:989 stop:1261 length:273 start_codon:yes stop_codon:yes gene_type:complete